MSTSFDFTSLRPIHSQNRFIRYREDKYVDEQKIAAFHEQARRIMDEIAREMVGQEAIVRQLLIAIICGSTMDSGGNVLLEGVPGLGKTRLVRTLGKVLDLSFSRIQFTPDLMPADVTGTNVILKDGERENHFAFQKGPVFAHIVLADEINRATPKTQSALLEAMQEHTVSAGGQTHPLPRPFFVLATQNPMEQEGTYPLPEAQLDRFFFKLKVDFPSFDELKQIVHMTAGPPAEDGDGRPSAQKVADGETILSMGEVAASVPMAEAVADYALRLVLATHPQDENAPEIAKRYIRYGASPRAAQALVAAARCQALFEGRYNVAFEDVQAVAPPVLRHRIVCNFEALAQGEDSESVIAALLGQLPRTVQHG